MNDVEKMLAEIDELDAKATAGPWQRCHHLQSAEHDASCSCGYRGSIWSGNGELVVCEMGHSPEHDGNQMTPIATREKQLADAVFIARARTLLPALAKLCREQAAELESVRPTLLRSLNLINCAGDMFASSDPTWESEADIAMNEISVLLAFKDAQP